MKNIKINYLVLCITIIISFYTVEYTLAQGKSTSTKPQSTSYSNYHLDDNRSGNSVKDNASDYANDRRERDYNYNHNDNIIEQTNRYKGYEDNNYFKVDRSGNTLWNGKHWESYEFPLKVYINNSSSRYFKSTYGSYVQYAMNVWEAADDRVKFKIVNSKYDSDISVTFIDNLMYKYDEEYLGITDYDMSRDNIIEESSIEISLLKFKNQKVSAGEIKSTIVHEFGHALGLGHSDNDNDIMYPYIDPDSTPDLNYKDLSIADINSVHSLMNLSEGVKYSRK